MAQGAIQRGYLFRGHHPDRPGRHGQTPEIGPQKVTKMGHFWTLQKHPISGFGVTTPKAHNTDSTVPTAGGPQGHSKGIMPHGNHRRIHGFRVCGGSLDPLKRGPKWVILGPRTSRFGGPDPEWVPFGTHLETLVRCIRIVGTPERPRSPSYLGGPSAGPIALAGSAVLLVMARTWPGPDLDPQNGQFWGPNGRF